MRRLVVLLILGLAGWQSYRYYEARVSQSTMPASPSGSMRTMPAAARSAPAEPVGGYKCDGRIYCSQMTSCEEAKYFLAHCPDVKMDGDGDGVPCERQWCTDG